MHSNPTFVFIALLSIAHAAPLNGPKNTDLINEALQVQPGRLVNVILQGNDEVHTGSSAEYEKDAEKILEAWYKRAKMEIPGGGFYIVTSGNSGRNRDGTLEFSVWGPAVSEKCRYEHSGCLFKYTPETQSVSITGGPERSLLSRFSLA
ncbi:hypothetical protein EV359DRAFT_60994 [Lentinula novae-zelandiae]|nr:hypothetical protein EV359DRAFT_60994 [Lentinula novae-zelandiae]